MINHTASISGAILIVTRNIITAPINISTYNIPLFIDIAKTNLQQTITIQKS